MRVPLAVSLESRDGTLSKDAKVLNGLIEVKGEAKVKLRKRPGCSDQGLLLAGTAQALTCWQGKPVAVIGDTINIVSTLASGTTWNPSDKGGGSSIQLSGGNLVAAVGGTTAMCRSVASFASGRFYYEVTVGGFISGGPVSIGVANGSASISAALGSDNNGIGLECYGASGNAQVIKNGAFTNVGLQVNSGDVVGVLVDRTASTITFYKNNAQIYTSSTALPSGTLYAAIGCNGAGSSSGNTANFGAGSFTYTQSGVSSTALNPTTTGLPFSMQDNGANAIQPYLMVKNATQAWSVTPGAGVALITDVDYPGQYTVTLTSLTRSGTTATATCASDASFQVGTIVTVAGAAQSQYNGAKTILSITPSSTTEYESVAVASITRSGTTATVTTKKPHGFATGQSVTIEGADQSEYNGSFSITWLSGTTFSYTVPVSVPTVTSPATGSPVLTAWIDGVLLNYSGTWLNPSPLIGGSYTNMRFTTFGNTPHGLPNGATVTLAPFGALVISNVSTASFDVTIGSISTQYQQVGMRATTSIAASSLTSDGITGTFTSGAAHNVTSAWGISVSGASPDAYNGSALPGDFIVSSTTVITYPLRDVATPATPATGTITATRAATAIGFSFTYEVTGSPATPATGTITVTGGRSTVPGIAYIDGYFVVMDTSGVIYTSREDDCVQWDPLDFTIAQAETGSGAAIAKSLQFVVAFKEWSTEFFFDAANDTGSPLSPVPNLFTLTGCASGFSVADVAGKLLWIGQTKKQTGRGVYMMFTNGEQQKVSTPDVDRIINADALTTVNAYGITLDGHPCYVLTLGASALTLVYDLSTQAWTQWTSLTLGSSKSITSITRSGTTCTVTFAVPHTLSDGDPVLIAGAGQSDYNGIKQIQYVSTTIATFETTGTPATPATGTITGTPYTESYFKFTKYASCTGYDYVLHETNGHLYKVLPSLFQDAGIPVNYFARTDRLDGDTQGKKKIPRIGVVGTSVSDTAMIRWSDDDSSTFAAYQPVTLSDPEPNIRRCGAFRKRSLEFRHIGNTAPVIEALELEISQ